MLNVESLSWSLLDQHTCRPRLWHTACTNSMGDLLIFGGCINNILDSTIRMVNVEDSISQCVSVWLFSNTYFTYFACVKKMITTVGLRYCWSIEFLFYFINYIFIKKKKKEIFFLHFFKLSGLDKFVRHLNVAKLWNMLSPFLLFPWIRKPLSSLLSILSKHFPWFIFNYIGHSLPLQETSDHVLAVRLEPYSLERWVVLTTKTDVFIYLFGNLFLVE